MKCTFIDELKSLKSFSNYLSKANNKDTLCCFDYGTLYNTDYHYGHVCVVDKVYIAKGEVRLIDPERNVPKWRTVTIKKLFEAMKRHGRENGGGFWEIQKIGMRLFPELNLSKERKMTVLIDSFWPTL